jgi:hypothetical protein
MFQNPSFPHAAKYMKTRNENRSSRNLEKLICLSHGVRLAFYTESTIKSKWSTSIRSENHGSAGAGDNLDVKCALEYGKDGIFYFGNSFFIACHSSSHNQEPQP